MGIKMRIEDSMDPAAEIEQRSFTELYDEYFDQVNRYLRYRAKNYWDADDLTTIVFIKALENFTQYNRTKSFGAWIFRIAQNTYIDYLRKKKEVPIQHEEWLADQEDPTWQPEEHVITEEERSRLKQTISSLTQDQRDVITLRYFADLKLAQIGEVIGKSESAIKMISKRALSRLKKVYEGRSEQ
jgi:RNA polymerase sigma factor (sigma-70 family)